MRSLLRSICLSLIVSASMCLAASAQERPDPTGRWNGFEVVPGPMTPPPSTALDVPPGPCRVFHMDIFKREGEREFHFMLAVPEWDKPIPGVLMLNGDGSVDIFARQHPSHARAHGMAFPVGGTHLFLGEGSYLNMKGETIHVLIGLLRNYGGMDWGMIMPPDGFRNVWLGNAMSMQDEMNHKMSLTLGNMVGSQFNGHSSQFGLLLPAVQKPLDSFFDVFTTVNGDGHNVTLGHDRMMNTWLLCDGSVRNSDNQLFGDGSVRGMFIWFDLDANGIPGVLDMGPFKLLPAVQRM